MVDETHKSPATTIALLVVVGVMAGAIGAASGLLGARYWGQADDNVAEPVVQYPPGPPPALVSLARVEQSQLQDRFDIAGRLRQVRLATVAAEVAGKIVALPVDEGFTVIGAQTVLGEIDDVWARLALQTTQAEVAAQQSKYDQAKRDLTYLKRLALAQSAKPKEVDDAQSAVDSFQAELDAALAVRARAAQEVVRLKVIAPFDGVVVEKMTEVGQWVEAGSPIVRIISSGSIDAVVDVPERLINYVHVGDSVPIVIEALEMQVVGEVVAVTPSGLNAARTFPVKIRLEDQDGKLKAGMSVTAKLPIGANHLRLTVPRDAVSHGPQGSVVWVAVSSNDGNMPTAMVVPVRVLFGHKDRLVIEPISELHQDILRAQSHVVIEGAERLFPGQPLDVARPTNNAHQ